MRVKRSGREKTRMILPTSNTEVKEKRRGEIEGRRKRLACEKETVSGRKRQRHCGDERDAGFVMAGDLQAFFVAACPPTLTLML